MKILVLFLLSLTLALPPMQPYYTSWVDTAGRTQFVSSRNWLSAGGTLTPLPTTEETFNAHLDAVNAMMDAVGFQDGTVINVYD